MSDMRWSSVCDRVDTCALTGAAAFYAGIPGAEILANGPLWCYFYALRHLEHTQLDMPDRFHGSQPDNQAVVYGTEACLTETVQRLLNSGHRPNLLFVENSCSISLIGDDVDGILRRMDLPFPAIAMDCGGLLGGFAEGWRKGFLTLLKRLEINSGRPEPLTVNLLGLTDYYYNGRADREEIVRLLKLAGYTVNAIPGAGSPVEKMEGLGKAALNIVFHEELGLEVAKYLEQQSGIPYVIAGIPYGTAGTRQWLETIYRELPAPRLDLVIQEAEEMQRYLTGWNNDTRMLWGDLAFHQALVSAPGTQALCLAETLRKEWADVDELTVMCQNPAEGDYCTVADHIYTAGQQDKEIERFMDQADNLLILGSSSENSVMLRKKRKFLDCDIAFPVKDEVLLIPVPFAGIRGSAHMQQRLWNCLIQSRRFLTKTP